MKIGKFKCSPEEFKRTSGWTNKFDYHTPLQVLASVTSREGIRYLVRKHKPSIGCAQTGWFQARQFQSFDSGLTLESLMVDKESNPYYWLHERDVRVTFATMDKNSSRISSMVLKKFEEDDE